MCNQYQPMSSASNELLGQFLRERKGRAEGRRGVVRLVSFQSSVLSFSFQFVYLGGLTKMWHNKQHFNTCYVRNFVGMGKEEIPWFIGFSIHEI